MVSTAATARTAPKIQTIYRREILMLTLSINDNGFPASRHL